VTSAGMLFFNLVILVNIQNFNPFIEAFSENFVVEKLLLGDFPALHVVFIIFEHVRLDDLFGAQHVLLHEQ